MTNRHYVILSVAKDLATVQEILRRLCGSG